MFSLNRQWPTGLIDLHSMTYHSVFDRMKVLFTIELMMMGILLIVFFAVLMAFIADPEDPKVLTGFKKLLDWKKTGVNTMTEAEQESLLKYWREKAWMWQDFIIHALKVPLINPLMLINCIAYARLTEQKFIWLSHYTVDVCIFFVVLLFWSQQT